MEQFFYSHTTVQLHVLRKAVQYYSTSGWGQFNDSTGLRYCSIDEQKKFENIFALTFRFGHHRIEPRNIFAPKIFSLLDPPISQIHSDTFRRFVHTDESAFNHFKWVRFTYLDL